MDYLTTNFPGDMSINHYEPFRLLELPLEVLIKVLIFLDVPDLISLSKTCHYLKEVANERFISRCRFYYTRNRLNCRLGLRPDTTVLYEQHIIPNKDITVSAELLSTASTLEKNLRRDSLSKSLRKRPSIEELKQKRIVRNPDTGAVDDIKLKLQNEALSEMLKLLLRSWRFQKKIVKSDVKMFVENDMDAEYMQIYQKVLNVATFPSFTPKETSKKLVSSSASSPASSAGSSSSRHCSVDSTSDNSPPQTPVMSRVTSGDFSTESTPDHDLNSGDIQSIHAVDTVDHGIPMTPQRGNDGSASHPSRRTESLNMKDQLHSVSMRKKYFEELASDASHFSGSRRSISSPEKVLNHIDRCKDPKLWGKPSRTMLKALVDDDIIHYEKLK